MRTEKSKWRTHKDERTKARHRGGITRSSDEVPEKRMERRGDVCRAELDASTSNGRNR